MEGGSSVGFGHGVAAGPVHPRYSGGGTGAQAVMPGAGIIPAGMSTLLFGVGMPAPGGNMVQPGPGGYLAAAGNGAMPLCAGWNRVAGAGAQQQPGRAGGGVINKPPPQKGPWTEQEDEALKALVAYHGMKKWAAIAKSIPGRIGKQCRERWTNHLRPNIEKRKDIWTEQDDEQLIKAHKIHGNRWSMIARDLYGRSENSVKNHWNATKRSLNSKRRIKKKKNPEARPGQQWSILEMYIRSQLPDADAKPEAAAPDSPPSSESDDIGYGEVVAPLPQPGFNPAVMGLYLNSAGSSSSAMGLYLNSAGSSSSAMGAAVMNPNVDLGLGLDAYYGAPQQQPLQAAMNQQQLMMMGHDQQQAAATSYYANLQMSYHQFVDNLAWHSSVRAENANAAAHHQPYYYYYYGDAGAGPSGTAGSSGGGSGDDDIDVVQMASREFQLNPTEEEVTLNLAGFM